MKNKILAFALSLQASLAFAHIEPGIYQGKTKDGTDCAFEAIRQYFEGGFTHPLNERIVIKIGAEEFTVGHPPVVTVAQSVAHFNHDVFQVELATPTGARALVIDMSHTQERKGPTAFHIIKHEWKNDARNRFDCTNLVFKP